MLYCPVLFPVESRWQYRQSDAALLPTRLQLRGLFFTVITVSQGFRLSRFYVLLRKSRKLGVALRPLTHSLDQGRGDMAGLITAITPSLKLTTRDLTATDPLRNFALYYYGDLPHSRQEFLAPPGSYILCVHSLLS